jgi:5-methylcytosine-specific restriction endonuclease McrA
MKPAMTKQIVAGSVEWLIAYREGAFKHVPTQSHLFEVRTPPKAAKPAPDLSNGWNNRITRLIERDGAKCHYCRHSMRIRRELADPRPDDATIDHKIPQSKGGSNGMENLALACRKCNEAKEDRNYGDFLARPYRIKRASGAHVRPPLFPASPWPKDRGPLRHPAVKAVLARFPGALVVDVREPKVLKGTMAAAIRKGEIDEAGHYCKAPRDLPAVETARWLRDQGELAKIDWPWLRELVRERVRQVGW